MTNDVQGDGGANPFYPVIEKMVVDEITRLDKQQITPWAFFNSGHPVRYKDFYGAEKSVGGALLFDGLRADCLLEWVRPAVPGSAGGEGH